jgi:hypothetical protein
MIVTENFRERISNSPLRAMRIEGWRGKAQDKRFVEANSTGGQGSRRAVEPGGVYIEFAVSPLTSPTTASLERSDVDSWLNLKPVLFKHIALLLWSSRLWHCLVWYLVTDVLEVHATDGAASSSRPPITKYQTTWCHWEHYDVYFHCCGDLRAYYDMFFRKTVFCVQFTDQWVRMQSLCIYTNCVKTSC